MCKTKKIHIYSYRERSSHTAGTKVDVCRDILINWEQKKIKSRFGIRLLIEKVRVRRTWLLGRQKKPASIFNSSTTELLKCNVSEKDGDLTWSKSEWIGVLPNTITQKMQKMLWKVKWQDLHISNGESRSWNPLSLWMWYFDSSKYWTRPTNNLWIENVGAPHTVPDDWKMSSRYVFYSNSSGSLRFYTHCLS